MDKIVFWRADTNDHYIHESPACPELRKALRVKSGTPDVARRVGRTERCPYCKNGIAEYSADKSLMPKGEPRTMRVSYAILMALVAVCFVWVVCYDFFDNQAKISTQSIYDQGYAAAQADAQEEADEQYRAGYDAGKKSGYDYGQKEGYNSGYTKGYSAGKSTANSAVDYNRGYDTGYKVGVAEGKSRLIPVRRITTDTTRDTATAQQALGSRISPNRQPATRFILQRRAANIILMDVRIYGTAAMLLI